MTEPPPEPEEPEEPEELEPRRYPSTIGGAGYILVMLGATAALLVTLLVDWRDGIRGLALCLVAAALMRLVLPRRHAGMLAVRHRALDLTLLLGAAAAFCFLAGSIPDQPGT